MFHALMYETQIDGDGTLVREQEDLALLTTEERDRLLADLPVAGSVEDEPLLAFRRFLVDAPVYVYSSVPVAERMAQAREAGDPAWQGTMDLASGGRPPRGYETAYMCLYDDLVMAERALGYRLRRVKAGASGHVVLGATVGVLLLTGVVLIAAGKH